MRKPNRVVVSLLMELKKAINITIKKMEHCEEKELSDLLDNMLEHEDIQESIDRVEAFLKTIAIKETT